MASPTHGGPSSPLSAGGLTVRPDAAGEGVGGGADVDEAGLVGEGDAVVDALLAGDLLADADDVAGRAVRDEPPPPFTGWGLPVAGGSTGSSLRVAGDGCAPPVPDEPAACGQMLRNDVLGGWRRPPSCQTHASVEPGSGS